LWKTDSFAARMDGGKGVVGKEPLQVRHPCLGDRVVFCLASHPEPVEYEEKDRFLSFHPFQPYVPCFINLSYKEIFSASLDEKLLNETSSKVFCEKRVLKPHA